ncbi:MAG: hypothetical protein IPQ09_25260 [Myxococcales bacterium]|nr:hypothetical protein [Myxococcales bacterium]
MRHSPSSWVFLALAGLACLPGALGCGGAAGGREPAAARRAQGADEAPRTIEEAQAAITRARAEIDRAGRPAPGAAPEPAQPAVPTAPAPPHAERPAAPSAGADAGCASPCRALASMRRAVGALCELTGSEDLRCVEATRTLGESEARVGPCDCR